MKRYKRRLTVTCPLCPSDEDTSHVWLCQSAQTQQQWSAALYDLRFWLEEQGTEPGLMDLLVLGLDSWRTQGTPPSAPHETLALRQALLGWQSIFEGRPAIGWAEIQDQYFKSLGSRRTEQRWIMQVLLKLVGIAWDLWVHRNGFLCKGINR